MAHTLDSVLGSGGLRLTVITTFSESFVPWCRLKKEPEGGGERGLSWMTSMEILEFRPPRFPKFSSEMEFGSFCEAKALPAGPKGT